MRFGPTSIQVSSVLSKGLRRPKLRSDLRISEQTVNGEKSYVIKNHETNSYNRYGEFEYQLLMLCDGTRTPAEISEALAEQDADSAIAESEVLEFLDSIEPAMWERSLGEKNLAVLERIRDERKGRVDQSSMLYISFKAWDPNKTLAKLDPYVSWIYTTQFVFFCIFLFITAAYFVAGDWSRVQRDTSSLYSFADKSAYDVWAFWILLLMIGAIHEFGHGLTCKHFGGDVHQMGFLLIYLTPAFYTDTTDILLFDRTSRRQWVIFAGIWIELVLCSISAVIWHFTAPGSIVNDLAYKAMLLSGIQGAAINLNPLIKADGYYALSQFLDIDNLREDAFAFLRVWSQKYILRRDIDLPPTSRRQRRIFLIFGVAAIFYSVALLAVVLLFAKNVLLSKFGDWGYFLFAGVVYFLVRKEIKSYLPVVRAWIRKQRESYMTWKLTRAQTFGVLGVALLLLIPPVPTSVSSELVLEPGKDAHLRTSVSGKIAEVLVYQGQEVKAGQLLAVLENPEIESTANVAAAELTLASSNLRQNQDQPASGKSAQAVRQRIRLQKELAVATINLDALRIRAPFDGRITTPEIRQRVGQFLAAGDEFCRLSDPRTMKARIFVSDRDLNDIRPGAVVRVKVLPYAFRTYSGHVEQILPAASADVPVSQTQKLTRLGQELTNHFVVVMAFPNSDGTLSGGMTGVAKITVKSRPLAWQVGRSTWHWLRSQVWW
ncbi:MAG: HlyD family efflux transporter periplasmic adaptor subunit [Candidatus Acidiferrales bacterium]